MKNYGRNGRRGSGAALYVTMAGAFLVIAVVTAMGLFFKITAIRVTGSSKYSEKEIIDASGLETDSSIFFVNMSGAEVRIMNALPYVDSVRVTRRLPGTVVITVTESHPAGYFSAAGHFWIIDASGRILEQLDSITGDAPMELRGIAAEGPQTGKTLSLGSNESVRQRCLMNLVKELDQWKFLDLTEWVDVSNLDAVAFYCNGYRINLHRADDLTELEGKFTLLSDFFADYPEPGHGQEIVYVDDQGYFTYRQ